MENGINDERREGRHLYKRDNPFQFLNYEADLRTKRPKTYFFFSKYTELFIF